MTGRPEEPSHSLVRLHELRDIVARLRNEGHEVVHVHGAFSLPGRAELERLSRLCASTQRIVVTLEAPPKDEALALAPRLRADILGTLSAVAGVAEWEAEEGEPHAGSLAADVFIEFDLLPPPPPSSDLHVLDAQTRSMLVYPKREAFSPEAESFLQTFRTKYTADDVIGALGSLRGMRVLVVGDAIIDEYHFVRPHGMPLKAPIIAAQFLESEAYAGGILAVANHIAGFCERVDLVTVLGDVDSRESFVRSSLHTNVQPTFFFRPDATTVTKRRYLRRFLLQKLFEVSYFDDRPLSQEVDARLAAYLHDVAPDYDLVVVADFGHGMLSQTSVDVLSSRCRFLALNTQLNSINYGYHVVTRYRHADYVCIDEEELRMACRDRTSSIQSILPDLAKSLGTRLFTVTRGHNGAMNYSNMAEVVTVPILSRQVIDTIGAGDAYLSLTAPCVAAGLPADMVGFVGNAMGALAVRIVGNKSPVSPTQLFQFVEHLLERG